MSQRQNTLKLILELLNRLVGLVQSLLNDTEQPTEAPPKQPSTPSSTRQLVDVPNWINITDAQAAPGAEYWQLKKVQYWNDQQSGGTHHIYTKAPHDHSVKMVVSNGHREWKVPLDKPSNEPSSNFAMWGGNRYKAWIDGLHSDSIEGMHMPANHHVSYLLWWEKVRMAQEPQVLSPSQKTFTPIAPSGNIVRTDGTKFTVNDRSLRFIGVNIRGLLHYGDHRLLRHSHPGHADEQLDAAQQMGARVVRVFVANRHLGMKETGNRLYNTLEKLKHRDMYAILSFTDVHHDTGFNVPGDSRFYQDNRLNKAWFEGGYKQNYQPFVEYLTNRFKDHPRIFAWELGNELKAWVPGVVLPDLFIKFAKDISNRIRELDKNHLITTGIINSGNLGCNPQQARRLYSLPNIDFITAHIYYSEQRMNQWMKLEAQRADADALLAKQLNIPFIIEEIGFEGGDRARQTEKHLHKWFDQKQVAGFMQWGFMGTNQDIGDGDNRFGLHARHDDYGRIVQCLSQRATMCAV